MKRIFRNPEGDYQTQKDGDTTFSPTSLQWVLSRIFVPPYKLGVDVPFEHVLSQEEALSGLKKYQDAPSLTWLGHASFLFRIGEVNIITDPLLFGSPATRLMRGLRRVPNPLQADVLPDIHVLLLSHEHADHLHHPSLRSLKKKANILPIVPMGVGSRLRKHGFINPVELEWGQSFSLSGVTITAVPAVHYSNFSNSTLWAGFVISFRDASEVERKIYFGGDTGYGSFISRDVAALGPFDVACFGIGGFSLPYKSRAPFVHTTPEQAVDVAKEIKAKKLIGMHWGTMRMADEDPNSLYPRMQKHALKTGYKGEVSVLRIGETIPI